MKSQNNNPATFISRFQNLTKKYKVGRNEICNLTSLEHYSLNVPPDREFITAYARAVNHGATEGTSLQEPVPNGFPFRFWSDVDGGNKIIHEEIAVQTCIVLRNMFGRKRNSIHYELATNPTPDPEKGEKAKIWYFDEQGKQFVVNKERAVKINSEVRKLARGQYLDDNYSGNRLIGACKAKVPLDEESMKNSPNPRKKRYDFSKTTYVDGRYFPEDSRGKLSYDLVVKYMPYPILGGEEGQLELTSMTNHWEKHFYDLDREKREKRKGYTNHSTSKLSTEFVRELLDNIGREFCDEYEPWTRIVWGLKHEGDEFYDLAVEWSMKSAKYEDGCADKLWDCELKEGGCTIGTVIHYVKESVSKPEWSAFLAKHGMKLQSAKPQRYDPQEPYYIGDYIREFSGKSYEMSKHEVWDTLFEKLKQCCLVLNESTTKTIVKESRNRPFKIEEKDLRTVYARKTVSYQIETEHTINGEKRVFVTTEKMNLFDPLEDKRLWFDSTAVIPFPPNIQPPIDDSTNRVLNTFGGFKAKFVDKVDMGIIQPVLDHISVVWANRDTQCFQFIMNWRGGIIV